MRSSQASRWTAVRIGGPDEAVARGGRRALMDKKKPQSPLPPVTKVKGLALKGAYELLSAEQRKKLQESLEEDQRVRQQAEASSANLRLS